MTEKIFSGNDKASDLGYADFRAMMRGLMERAGFKPSGIIGGESVYARVDFGRWLADCECGGAGYVEPADPVFFCVSCGNATSQGAWREVIFPENRDAIEAELLTRQVLHKARMKPVEAAMNATSLVPGLARNWSPGETVQTLRGQKEHALQLERIRQGKGDL